MIGQILCMTAWHKGGLSKIAYSYDLHVDPSVKTVRPTACQGLFPDRTSFEKCARRARRHEKPPPGINPSTALRVAYRWFWKIKHARGGEATLGYSEIEPADDNLNRSTKCSVQRVYSTLILSDRTDFTTQNFQKFLQLRFDLCVAGVG